MTFFKGAIPTSKTSCKQPTAVHNLIDGSVHNSFHLNNAFPGLNPTHTYARSLTFYARAEIEEPLFIGRFSRIGGRDEKREKRTSPFRHFAMVDVARIDPPDTLVSNDSRLHNGAYYTTFLNVSFARLRYER